MDSSDITTELITFFDAITAADACRYLEEVGIPFTVKNWGIPSQGIDRFNDPPPVQLQILVAKQDVKRSQELLRNAMHLFPEREVADPQRPTSSKLDDEGQVQVAACEERSDAEEIREALKDSNICSNVRQLSDEDDPTWRSYSVEVKYEDAERAFRAVERWSEAE